MFEDGNCDEGDENVICEKVRELRHTSDGGKTWQPITLPTGKTQDVTTFVYNIPKDNHSQLLTGQVVYYSGQAFDACEIPSLNTT